MVNRYKKSNCSLLLAIIIMSILSIRCQSSSRASQVQTVNNFDINKYMGLWYEIARLDHSFERGMDSVTASYSINPDGTVKVENRGYKKGKLHTAIGKARRAKGSAENSAELEVSFFWIFYSPYRIIILDPEYRYSVVTSNDDYLWILSRTPQLPDSTLQQILENINSMGIDTEELIYPAQPSSQIIIEPSINQNDSLQQNILLDAQIMP